MHRMYGIPREAGRR